MAENEQKAEIQVQDLHKSFGRQKVLDGLGLEIRKGETVAVLGRSGTGKSVLLKLLIGLQPADSILGSRSRTAILFKSCAPFGLHFLRSASS